MVVTRYRAALITLLAAPLLVPSAKARQSTPAASPVMVDPAECQVAPRPIEDFDALLDSPTGAMIALLRGTPIATPFVPAGSVLADPAVVAAVNATLRELAGCVNTGDFRRFAALFTDEAFLRFFAGDADDVEPEDRADSLAELASPVPVPPDEQAAFQPFAAVLMLPDGRVAAFTPDQIGEEPTIFVEVDGRYLIDSVPIVRFTFNPDATPTGCSAAAPRGNWHS